MSVAIPRVTEAAMCPPGRSLLQPLLRLFALFAACLALALAVVSVAHAEELQPVPPLQARVTDLTATLSAEQRSRLEAKLAAFENEKGVQVAVLIVPTTQPEAIEQYAIRVAEAWKLGRLGIDDGALLLVAKQDRKLRIEVGYGLEGVLNDATAKRIVAETITPHFRERRFYEGIDAGIDRILAVVRGEALPAPKDTGQPRAAADDADFGDLWLVGLALATVVAGILRAIFGRFLGSAIVGGAAGAIVMFVVSSLLIATIAGVVVFVVALLSGGAGGWSGRRGGMWGGGSLGGSWGGSGGGFSGGGGSFGGGGASGDW